MGWKPGVTASLVVCGVTTSVTGTWSWVHPAQPQLLHNNNYNSGTGLAGLPGPGYTCPVICKQTRDQPTSQQEHQWAFVNTVSRANRIPKLSHFWHVSNPVTDMNRLLTTGVCFLLTAQPSQSQFGQPTNANPFVDQVGNWLDLRMAIFTLYLSSGAWR